MKDDLVNFKNELVHFTELVSTEIKILYYPLCLFNFSVWFCNIYLIRGIEEFYTHNSNCLHGN